ncbi:MAG: hypothetical protein JWQ98_342 [Chlorobi bacterium]|nr:hypothetical protein [Chlorobiota bacterium]
MPISHPDAGSGNAPATLSRGTSGCFLVWIMKNASRPSATTVTAPATEDDPQTSIQRILHLLWEAMPFLDAIGDSFRVLADDPTDDVASRAAIPAHVKSLLEEAVIEIAELERELGFVNDNGPAALPTTGQSDIVPNVVRDGNSIPYRIRHLEPVPDETYVDQGEGAEREMSLNEVLRGTGVVTAQ